MRSLPAAASSAASWARRAGPALKDVSRCVTGQVTQMDERAAALRWALVGRMRRVATMLLHAPGACTLPGPGAGSQRRSPISIQFIPVAATVATGCGWAEPGQLTGYIPCTAAETALLQCRGCSCAGVVGARLLWPTARIGRIGRIISGYRRTECRVFHRLTDGDVRMGHAGCASAWERQESDGHTIPPSSVLPSYSLPRSACPLLL